MQTLNCSFPVCASGPSLTRSRRRRRSAPAAWSAGNAWLSAFALDTRQDHGVWRGMSDTGTAEPADTAQLLSTLAREGARLAATAQPFSAAFAVAEMTMRADRPQWAASG